MENKLAGISKLLLYITSLALIVSIFVPIWRIELDAPQYPEGLMMQIYASKLGGQVDIINGLNHYIGMATLHAENFIEFTLLPYIIGFYALLIFITGFSENKKILYFSFCAFLLFGIVSMVDFWRWDYNYGHNLDPNAAIIEPGMSYQPPLIGFKQLLNFGAYSVPDIGGWLMVLGGLCMLVAVVIETKVLHKSSKKQDIYNLVALLALSGTLSCSSSEIEPIKLNSDKCDHCKMTISDGRFGAELKTKKGRIYKFDDIQCLQDYRKEYSSNEFVAFYVHSFPLKNELKDATKAFFVTHESLRSPMGGNTAAFENKAEAQSMADKLGVEAKTWQQTNQ